MRRALHIAGVALLMACQARDRTPAQAASPFADSVTAAVGLLRAGMTLGAWIEAHPGDSIKLFDLPVLQPSYYSPRSFALGDWCARAIRHGSITTLAYFYPPSLAPGTELPASQPDAHQSVRRGGCTLGLVLLVSPDSDSSRSVALAADLQRAMQQRFGAGPNGVAAATTLSRYWSGTLAWQSGGLAFAVAFSRDSGVHHTAEEEDESGEVVRHGEDQRGVVAVAYRPRPGIGDWWFARLDDDDRGPVVPDASLGEWGRGPAICANADSLIRTLGRYLATSRPQAMQARAHLALARAYSDRLLGPTPGDAAARSAEHYRAALRLGRGMPIEATAWNEGWRVSAGLLPVRLRFYCSSGD